MALRLKINSQLLEKVLTFPLLASPPTRSGGDGGLAPPGVQEALVDGGDGGI